MTEREAEALDELRQIVNECHAESSSVSYGHFHGGDPRKFSPDHECSTDAEREAHAAACKRWDAGEKNPLPGPHEPIIVDGKMCGHVTLSGFGLGTNPYEDEVMLDLAERLQRILERLETHERVHKGREPNQPTSSHTVLRVGWKALGRARRGARCCD